MDCADIVRKFGSSSTIFMTTSEARKGLERTISHTSTRVSTSAKVAVRKIRGGRLRGMRVLAHMNTARWGSMNTADREEAIQWLFMPVSVWHTECGARIDGGV